MTGRRSVFTDNYRHYCREAGLSAAQVSLALGVALRTVRGWDEGRIPHDLYPVATILGITCDQLLEPREGASAAACDVWLIGSRRICGAYPARMFRAQCACGHAMEGMSCGTCLSSPKPGCLTCWREKKHRCPVSLAADLAGAA